MKIVTVGDDEVDVSLNDVFEALDDDELVDEIKERGYIVASDQDVLLREDVVQSLRESFLTRRLDEFARTMEANLPTAFHGLEDDIMRARARPPRGAP